MAVLTEGAASSVWQLGGHIFVKRFMKSGACCATPRSERENRRQDCSPSAVVGCRCEYFRTSRRTNLGNLKCAIHLPTAIVPCGTLDGGQATLTRGER
jgi:hypothetical protein